MKLKIEFNLNFTNVVCAIALFFAIAYKSDSGVFISGLGLIGRAVIDLAKAWRGNTNV